MLAEDCLIPLAVEHQLPEGRWEEVFASPLRPQHFLSALAFCSAKLFHSLTCLDTKYFVSRAKFIPHGYAHIFAIQPWFSYPT